MILQSTIGFSAEQRVMCVLKYNAYRAIFLKLICFLHREVNSLSSSAVQYIQSYFAHCCTAPASVQLTPLHCVRVGWEIAQGSNASSVEDKVGGSKGVTPN